MKVIMKFIFALLTKHNFNNDYMKKKHKVVKKASLQ